MNKQLKQINFDELSLYIGYDVLLKQVGDNARETGLERKIRLTAKSNGQLKGTFHNGKNTVYIEFGTKEPEGISKSNYYAILN